MSLLWFLLYALIVALISYYGGKKLIHSLIILNEYKLQQEAPKVTWEYEDMIRMAQSKKDQEMNDEEFNIKYGAYRHEIYRTTSVTRDQYDFLGRIMHFAELYLVHGGYASLEQRVKIIRPIFIIGDFRSGTSVLERIVEHHPSICAFSTTHAHIWSAPALFEKLVDWLDGFRILCGCEGWNSPKDKGMFYPHSSNNVLSRNRPMECESIWLQCNSHYSKERHYEWDSIDSATLNPDNSTDCDLLDAAFCDERFEKYLKTSIRMLLAHRRCTRFIWKNPMNGFRIGFIKKMFPDAQFIFISRNPAKTLKSQLIMEKVYCRAHFIDDVQQFRKENMKPHPPYYNRTDSWYHLFHSIYPNDMYGHLLWPRVWPRVQPEHCRIQQYLKEDKTACACAAGIVQHDRVVRETFADKKNGIAKEKGNLFEIWHEDVLADPLKSLKNIHNFLGLECDDEDRIRWLEMEDFPGGKANVKRVQQSSQWEKGLNFGSETEEAYEILEKCLNRYNNRLCS